MEKDHIGKTRRPPEEQISKGGEQVAGERREPLLGWRIWRLNDGILRSCVVDAEWVPGVNSAICKSETTRCSSSPGYGCRCGFWAVSDLDMCLQLARGGRSMVWGIGLVRGWGEVAVHGRQGFRAEKAAVVCLFSDWLGALPTRSRLPRWLRRWLSDAAPPPPQLQAELQEAASGYAVPLLSIAEALRSGFLEEVGMEANRREIAAWCAR